MNEVAPPRISRRRAVLLTIAALTLAGVLVGALWAWLAPSIHGVVALTKSGERVKAYLGNEADHFFISAFLLVGMLGAVAVVAAVLLWQWKAHRGPAMVAALAIGAAAATGAAAGVGALLVRLRYGTVDIAGAPVSPEHRVHYVVEAPAVFFGHSPLHIAATPPAARCGRGAGLCVVGGVYAARRSRRVAAGRRAGDRAARHSGERSTVRPVTTFAAIFISRAMPT